MQRTTDNEHRTPAAKRLDLNSTASVYSNRRRIVCRRQASGCGRLFHLPHATFHLPLALNVEQKLWLSRAGISTGKLSLLPDLHFRPINAVVFCGPSEGSRRLAKPPFTHGRYNLGACFMLRCFQHLSLPDFATQPCHGRDSWYTRGLFIPVLSY